MCTRTWPVCCSLNEIEELQLQTESFLPLTGQYRGSSQYILQHPVQPGGRTSVILTIPTLKHPTCTLEVCLGGSPQLSVFSGVQPIHQYHSHVNPCNKCNSSEDLLLSVSSFFKQNLKNAELFSQTIFLLLLLRKSNDSWRYCKSKY